MSLLSDQELVSMRATAAEALDGTAVIQTQQLVSDGGGGGTTTWMPSGTVDCRIAPYSQSSGEMLEGEQVMNDAEVVITMPAETEIEADARVVSDGRTYTAVAIRRRSEELTRRFAAKEIK
jgi:SPP1 family predicted phage head-tail adaptor